MSKEGQNKDKKENEFITNAPAPPVKPKKHIKYRIVHGPYQKTKTFTGQNLPHKNNDKNKEVKLYDKLTPLPSNDDWSIFSPNFMNTPNQEEEEKQKNYQNNNEYNTNNKEKNSKKISKSVMNNIIQSDDEKILSLEKEINGLKETNQNILNLIMEKEKENRLLINNIDKLKMESIEKLSNYLNHIEELGKKFKFSNDDDEDINLDINNNLKETNELNRELNKNRELKKILNKKNEEFNDIYNAIQKLVFTENSPLFKESNLNLKINDNDINKNRIIENEDKNEENEIINIENEYQKLKNDYKKLIEKYKKNEQKNRANKNRIKFVYKDIPQNQKEKYESQIKELIEENQKIKKNYNIEIEKLNISIASAKVELLNKQFDKETKLLNVKKKIKQMIRRCKQKGIKLNNELINIK